MAYDLQGNVIVLTNGARVTEDPANPSTGDGSNARVSNIEVESD